VAQGLLLADSERYGALGFGGDTRLKQLLRGEAQLLLRLPPPRRERRRQPATTQAHAPAELAANAAPVLQALKDWRREQARLQGVPPYVVFHDRTLVEVVARRPRSLEELAGIGGVGQAKLDRYGAALLESLDAAILHQETHPPAS